MASFLALRDLDKSFGDHRVLREISLGVEEGETLVLLGPSGSGKTTLLRAIAGFEMPDRGSLRVAGEEVLHLPPAKRNFGMVFQHYALFPHLTVGQNVAFGLESRGIAAGERGRQVAAALALVDLEGFEERRVDQISGGQQQRVALARALAPHPQVLLLDEPLSNLDRDLRERTRRQIRHTLQRVGITAVWVTHEQDEAFDVGDRVAVLHDGRLQQVGRPEKLYLEPATPFVARFVGRSTSLTGGMAGDDRVRLDAGDGSVVWRGASVEAIRDGRAVEILFRPEGLELAAVGSGGSLPGRVSDRRYAGAATYYTVAIENGGEVEVLGDLSDAAENDPVAVAPRAGGPVPRIFPAIGEG
jgi:ABC-type Fe3+/spermidine/putrescine transport system ATPase subunit